MGQTLSEPSQEKITTSGINDLVAFAVSEMQGWRITMEDSHATILDLEENEHNAFFAVYDGHGGSSVAKYSGQHVHQRLAGDDAYEQKDYKTALKRAFLGTDEDLRADPSFFHDPSGCTAVSALVTRDKKIFCANAGDSRAVLSVKGEAKPLSFDHKPTNQQESARITAAGGYVEFNRVNGNLALSRAIGDFEFKQNFALSPEKQVVTSDPEITVHDITDEDEFIIIACDGIWDCMSSQETINWVRHNIALGHSLEEICEATMNRCLSPDSDIQGGVGCDNMTILIVAILNGRTLDEWRNWVKQRVENEVGYKTPREFRNLYPERRYNRGVGAGGSTFHSGGGDSSVYPNTGSGFLRTGTWLSRTTGISSMTLQPLSAGSDDSDDDADMSDGRWEDASSDEEASKTDKAKETDLDTEMEDGSKEGAGKSLSPPPFLSNGPTSIGSPVNGSPLALQDLRSESPSPAHPKTLQGEAPPPPKPVNKSESAPIEQAKAQPAGDAPSDALKAEGFMDSSEVPTKM